VKLPSCGTFIRSFQAPFDAFCSTVGWLGIVVWWRAMVEVDYQHVVTWWLIGPLVIYGLFAVVALVYVSQVILGLLRRCCHCLQEDGM
jgi:hypothetical protein